MPLVQEPKEKRTPFQAIREIFSKIPKEIWLYFYDTKLVLGEIDKETGEYKNTQIKYCYLGNIDKLPTETKKQVLEIKTRAEIIEDHEFGRLYSNLRKVELLDGVLEIKLGVFEFCKELKELKIGKGLKRIPSYCFKRNGLEKVEIPSNIQQIGQYAFSDCPLKEVVFEEGLEEIGEAVFLSTNLEQIKIPKSTKKIGERVFAFSKLRLMQILGDGTIKIYNSAFYGCNHPRIEATYNKDVKMREELLYNSDDFKIVRVENIKEDEQPTRKNSRKIEFTKEYIFETKYPIETYGYLIPPTVHPQMPNKPNEVDNEKPSNPTNPSNGIER